MKLKFFLKRSVTTKACTYLGHVLNNSIFYFFRFKFEWFCKLDSQHLFYCLLFFRDGLTFLCKPLVDIIMYDLLSKKFKYVINFNLSPASIYFKLFVHLFRFLFLR